MAQQLVEADNARQQVRDHIVEKILTLACPRCGQAFVDFSGCLALTCSRQGCGTGFCALCQEDCGGDAHPHVGEGCPIAREVGAPYREFYIPDGSFPELSSKAKAIKLRAYGDETLTLTLILTPTLTLTLTLSRRTAPCAPSS